MNMLRKELFTALCLCCVLWVQSSGAESNCEWKEKSSISLEIAVNLIKKTKEIIPDCPESVTNKSKCGANAKMTAYLDIAEKLIAETRDKYPTCIDDVTDDRNVTEPVILTTETNELTTEQPIKYPIDCFEVLQNNRKLSGVYTIWLDRNRTLEVFCDMETDGGGWTVIQRRGNFTPLEDFFRDWKDYKNGFGRITKDFWIGNDNIFALTNQSKYGVKFDLEDMYGNKAHALYDSFWIEDETAKYRLHIDGYSGNAGDAMKDTNNIYFSTKDRHNANSTTHCSRDLSKGGWWYSNCGFSNPNGQYLPDAGGSHTMHWYTWKQTTGLVATEIKLQRKM